MGLEGAQSHTLTKYAVEQSNEKKSLFGSVVFQLVMRITMAYKKAPLWDSHHQPKSQMDWDSFLWLKNCWLSDLISDSYPSWPEGMPEISILAEKMG